MTLDELIEKLEDVRNSYPLMGKVPIEVQGRENLPVNIAILNEKGAPVPNGPSVKFIVLY